MPVCPNCAQSNEPNRRYCGSCGARMDPVNSPPATSRTEVTTNDGTPSKESMAARLELDTLTAEVKRSPTSPDAYLRLGMAQLTAGKAERAFSTYRAGKAIAPDDVRIHRLGAQVFEALGRHDEALDSLDAVTRLSHGGDLEAALQAARILHESGRRQKALERLQVLRESAPQRPEILLRLAEIELSLGDAVAAQNDLSLYRRQTGESREMFLLLGQAMMAQSFHDGAIRHYREALASYPDDVDLRLGLGRAYLGTGERGQALLEFERALSAAPTNVAILLEMGRLYGDMGMEDKAEELFERIRKQNTRDGDIFLTMARYYQGRRQPVRARTELERARSCSPHHPEVVKMLGEILEAENSTAKALAEYEQFLEGLPGTVWAMQGVIRCARAQGEFARVAKAQKAFIEAGHATPDSWCDLGETLIRLGSFPDAEKAFETAARLDPSCVRAYQAPELIRIEKARADGDKLVQQAREAIQKKFLLTAVERLERALELVPRETSWMRLLAEVSLRIGSFGRAAEMLSKVRAADSRDVWVSRQLARVYESEEKQPLAIELLSSALKDQPADVEAHITLLRLKRGQIKGDRFERDMHSSMLRHLQAELAPLGKTSPVPALVEGYAQYIFGMGTRFQSEAMTRAQELFEEALYRSSDDPWAQRGLSLVFRVRGDVKKAAHHLQELVKQSSDPAELHALARLHENFQFYGDAHRCYSSLKNLFPDNGLYHRRIIEMLSQESETGSKNLLMEFLGTAQESVKSSQLDPWAAYDLAMAQTIIARRSTQREEWAKRALLSWNKAASMNDAPPWFRWGLMEAQLEFLKGAERLRALNQNLKACEKIAREHPDMAAAHAAVARCYLGFEDLAQTDRAAKHLETAVFLEPHTAEQLLLLAKTYRELGRAGRVDAVRQTVILLEPELSLKM
ncbi:MAG TPA: tetratricopeptide repeat protein [Candidatus Ozemobacteraceae bacterium]|nr:tetratricopeptide repeat protein [Candidatus Ozemobacteraceae bacterium]